MTQRELEKDFLKFFCAVAPLIVLFCLFLFYAGKVERDAFKGKCEGEGGVVVMLDEGCAVCVQPVK